MSNIPEEYSSIDFGFSAIDEATFKANQAEAETTPPSIDENDLTRVILNALEPIENKIDSLMKRKNIDEEDEVKFAVGEVNEKVMELEKLIMPILVNLLKTADKEYIHWPNRENQVQGMIDKVLAISRG
tara:strand:+ start:237 stop:623 length:387 start_codon:yes stop_codon:yes gene_type:complete